MFKFSYNWLRRESDIDVSYDELMKWLVEQGFEIESITDVGDDKLIEIEVKANRPDMLYVSGVLREYYAAKKEKAPKEYSTNLSLDVSANPKALSHEFRIPSKDVHRYFAVEIRGVDNTRPTPPAMAELLTAMGVAVISPVVDVSNYVLLLLGQPIHIFDADKVKGAITVENFPTDMKFVTLGDKTVDVPAGALVISDEEGPLCLAGIIGGHKAEVDRNTKNIIIESANFDHIIERTTSKKSRVSTMASYRFERGVDICSSQIGGLMTAEMIHDLCGGTVAQTAFEHYPEKDLPKKIRLTTERTNRILGSELSAERIAELLGRCFFQTEILDAERMDVTVPHFRLDIEEPIDLIEEVGRMFGYQNIEPKPIKLDAPPVVNLVHENTARLRELLVGFGFIEFLTYGFISDNAMESLRIDASSRYFGDVLILNPLSSAYALMRPTMAWSLIASMAANLALGTTDVKIFEAGKTYFRDAAGEDGYRQRDVLAGLLTGTKLAKGFGLTKDQVYNVFDAVGLVSAILDDYGFDYEIRNTDKIGFFDPAAGADIIIGGETVGCVGRIDPAVLARFENGKLARNEVLYFEMNYDGFRSSQKSIAFESNFPGIKREYNFVVPNGLRFADYKKVIEAADTSVVGVEACDVYQGKGVEPGTAAVLVSVKYNAVTRTLESAEIEAIEKRFLHKLLADYQIRIRL